MPNPNELTCELCGRPINRKIYRIVEGVKLLVCSECQEYGDIPKPRQNSTRRSNERYYDRSYQSDTQSSFTEKKSITKSGYVNKIRNPRPQNFNKGPGVEDLELVLDYRNILRNLRQKNKMNQSEFANTVGISDTTYKHVESGKMDLTVIDAKKIEKKYNVKLTHVYNEDEDEIPAIMEKKSSEYTLGDVFFKRKKGGKSTLD